MMKYLKIIFGAFVVMLLYGILNSVSDGGLNRVIGSVVVGNEYYSQHLTSANASSTSATFGKTGNATLGSVVITVPASAGTFNIYNATNTDAFATSSGTLITSFSSASDVAGTYVFDTNVDQGIMFDITADFDGEYTVTYR